MYFIISTQNELRHTPRQNILTRVLELGLGTIAPFFLSNILSLEAKYSVDCGKAPSSLFGLPILVLSHHLKAIRAQVFSVVLCMRYTFPPSMGDKAEEQLQPLGPIFSPT
jgi:hypothetical protein